MIDTITLELDARKRLESKDFANKSKWGINYQQDTNNEPKYSANVVLDWPEEAKAKWSYLPEVKYMNYPNTYRKDGGDERCSKYWITFSAPKLLYGNNIEEVTEAQYDDIVRTLCEQLSFLGLPTKYHKLDIEMAKIRRVDFSKNTMIAELVPIDQFCTMLMRAKHEHRSKFSQVQYRHGELYRENTRYRSVVIYDKLAEFRNTLNKKEPANARGQFFLSAEKAHLFQVFKLEVQIENSNQIAIELKRFGLERKDITFRSVFSEQLAHDILMRYWTKIVEKLDPNPELFSEDNLWASFNTAIINRGNKTPQNFFASFGLSYLAHKFGLNNLKDIVYREYGDQAWSRLEKLYEQPKLDQGLYTFISSMERIIDTMEPLQFGEYNGVFDEEGENGTN